jgi:hypothetical protein
MAARTGTDRYSQRFSNVIPARAGIHASFGMKDRLFRISTPAACRGWPLSRP